MLTSALSIVLAAAAWCGQLPPPANQPVSPTTQPGEFQPGVRIDWDKRRVLVRARVLDTIGPIEFFACGGGKEHESILLLEARTTNIFQALGLIGLTPGKPFSWDEAARRAIPAEGDLVDLHVEWTRDSAAHDAAWNEWVLDAEFLRSPLSFPFVFAGSLLRPDGRLACETSGAAIALVDMPDALLAPLRSRSDRSNELWALANRAALPAPNTPVTLVLAAATPRRVEISLDFRGDFRVDGDIQSVADVADLLKIGARNNRPATPIRVEKALVSDIRRASAALTRFGVAADDVRFQSEPASAPQSSPAP